jgi:RNA polymerase sigma-70 factor (ECF subfamily)
LFEEDKIDGLTRLMRARSSSISARARVLDGMCGTDGESLRPGDNDPAAWSALMAGAQDGDRDSYRRLLLAVTPYLRAIASQSLRNPHDVEDVVQDILMTIHTIRHVYDPVRPFKPWLRAIARHRIVDHIRRRRRTVQKEVVLTPEHEILAIEDARIGMAAWGSQSLHTAVQQLPDRQRRAVELLKLGEMSLKEASVKSGMSVAALKVATHRGLRLLRRILAHAGSNG